jgi:hypothetical protein
LDSILDYKRSDLLVLYQVIAVAAVARRLAVKFQVETRTIELQTLRLFAVTRLPLFRLLTILRWEFLKGSSQVDAESIGRALKLVKRSPGGLGNFRGCEILLNSLVVIGDAQVNVGRRLDKIRTLGLIIAILGRVPTALSPILLVKRQKPRVLIIMIGLTPIGVNFSKAFVISLVQTAKFGSNRNYTQILDQDQILGSSAGIPTIFKLYIFSFGIDIITRAVIMILEQIFN